MKNLLVIALVIGLAFGVATVVSDGLTKRAEARVNGMLEGWARGGIGAGTDIQAAVSWWAEGVAFVADADRLAGASDDFDAWRRSASLYRPIREFAVTQVVPNRRFLPDEFIVHATIDGTATLMLVRGRTPIKWTDRPSFD